MSARYLISGLLLSAFSLLLLPSMSRAQDAGIKDFRVHQIYQSPRALGMGNAVTAIADDYST
ncbi:MAG: hypothetical protein EOP05_15680, partial [Proteobacteria bacterium]